MEVHFVVCVSLRTVDIGKVLKGFAQVLSAPYPQ